MKAVRLHKEGGPEQLVYEDAHKPQLGAGDALIRVHAFERGVAGHTRGKLALAVCASFTGARSGRGSPAADDEHRWHKGPVEGTAVLGPSTATPLSPLLPPGTGRIAVQPT